MRRIVTIISLFVLPLLIGCVNEEVVEYDLIEGNWLATAGYQDGEPKGDSSCAASVKGGLEFKDEETVYVEAYETNFEYSLENSDSGVEIHLAGSELGIYLSYHIDKVSENGIGLTSEANVRPEDESCYLERKE